MRPEQRLIVERDCCELRSEVRVAGLANPISCKIVNISMQGAGLVFDEDVPDLPTSFSLSLPLIDDATDERNVELRWREGRLAGVRFV